MEENSNMREKERTTMAEKDFKIKIHVDTTEIEQAKEKLMEIQKLETEGKVLNNSHQEFILVLSGFVKNTLKNPKEATPEELKSATDIAKVLVDKILPTR